MLIPEAVWLAYPITVGGVGCLVADCRAALEALARAPGLMVRQPLLRAGCVLAACDYHAVAAPWLPLLPFIPGGTGRGAAGRHRTKTAFCAALHAVTAWAASTDPLTAYREVTAAAWAAFATDCGYGVLIARAATALAARQGREPSGILVGSGDSAVAREAPPPYEISIGPRLRAVTAA